MRFLAAGDTAVAVEFGDAVERASSDRVLALAKQLRRGSARRRGRGGADLPLADGALRSVPHQRQGGDRRDSQPAPVQRRLTRAPAAAVAHPRLLCAESSRSTSPMSPSAPACAGEEIIARHLATRFHVYMIGFSPGHPYMGDLPPELALPRRSEPRIRVPRGGIGVAARLSVIYPADSPSGWHLIGATPIELFNPVWPQPSLLASGDAVQFERIDHGEFETIRAAVAAGRFAPVSEELPA